MKDDGVTRKNRTDKENDSSKDWQKRLLYFFESTLPMFI